MRRVWPRVAVLVAVLAASFSAPWALAVDAGAKKAPRAILVMATGLTWEDISATGTPAMWRLASEGGVGNLNARPRARESSWEPASALEGALGLSCGSWAVPEFSAQGAYCASETARGVPVSAAYERLYGAQMSPNAIAYLGLAPVDRTNASSGDKPVPGTLGQAVVDAGGSTCAIGNSDSGDSMADYKFVRPAAVAAMDERGLVMFGDVSTGLTMRSADSPYGIRTDLDRFERALSACEASAAAKGGPVLIALDPGDEYRARRAAWQTSDAMKAKQHVAAVREADDIVAMALAHTRPDDIVVVCTQAPADTSPGMAGFSPLLVSGGGLRGYLTSASTHRVGTVSNPDITALVLAHLGLERPVEVIGSTLSAVSAPAPAAERIAHLSAKNATAVSVDVMRGTFADIYIKLFSAVMVIGIAFVFVRDQLSPRVRRAIAVGLKAAGLLAVLVPGAGLAMFVLWPTPSTPAEAGIALGATTTILFAAALLVWKYLGGRVALAGSLLTVSGLFVVDQLLGAPFAATSLIGYSPLQGVRFYGIGNEAAGMLVGAALVGSALVVDISRGSKWGSAFRRYGIPAYGLLAVVACAAPGLGANVGVALWATIGFGVLWTWANGQRLTWKHAIAGLLAVVALIGGFAALDMLRAGEKTHLARSLSSAEQGGLSQLWMIVSRKAQMNGRILAQTNWTTVLMAVAAFLGVTRLRPAQELTRVSAKNPAFGGSLVACTVAGVLAFLSEDTGVLVPTFIFVSVGVATLWLVVSEIQAEEDVV
jgi:hypothetical protein